MELVNCVVEGNPLISGSGYLHNVKIGPQARVHGGIMRGGELYGTLEGSPTVIGSVVVHGMVSGTSSIHGSDIQIYSHCHNSTVSGREMLIAGRITNAQVYGEGTQVLCDLEGHQIYGGIWKETPILVRGLYYEVQEVSDRLIRIGCTTLKLDDWIVDHEHYLKNAFLPEQRGYALKYYKRVFKLICEIKGWEHVPF